MNFPFNIIQHILAKGQHNNEEAVQENIRLIVELPYNREGDEQSSETCTKKLDV